MKIRVGRGAPGWQGNQPPSNVGMAGVATQRMNHVVAAHNRRHEEALRVDGIEIGVWLKGSAGVRCTCSATESETALPSIEENDGGQVLAPRRINRFDPTPGVTPESDPTRFSQLQAEWERPGWVTSDNKERLARQDMDDKYPSEDQIDVVSDDMLDSVLGESSLPEDDLALLSEGGTLLYGHGQTRCGICLGTGWTGGYSLVNGQRIILDFSSANDFELNGWTVEPTHPTSASAPRDTRNEVTWRCALPKYFKRVYVQAMDNLDIVDDALVLDIKINGAWVAFNETSLHLYSADLNDVLIRARPLASGFEEPLSITHIDIVFEFTNPVFADMPQLTLADNLDYLEVIIDTTFELPAALSELPRGTLLQENKHGYIWKLTDITNFKTAGGLLSHVTASARLVHSTEQLHTLKRLRQVVPNVKPYRSLERIQGKTAGLLQRE